MLKLPWNEPWDLEGFFWRPGDEDHRFYGSLHHEPENGTQIHLVGSSLMDAAGRRPPPPLIPVLHGQSTGGTSLSVINVYSTRWTGGATSTLDAVSATVAAGHPHLIDLDSTQVRHASLDLHGLRETFAGVWPYGGGTLAPRKVPGGLSDHLTAELGHGARLEVEVGEVEDISRGRVRPREHAKAVFHFDEPRAYSELVSQFIHPLRDFVALATRRQSYVTTLYAAPSIDSRSSWRVASTPSPRPNIQGTRRIETLAVDLSAVGDPAVLLRRWFELRKRVGAVWTTFFAAVYGGATLDDQFLSLTAFAEGYHRALHDSPPLTKAQDRIAQKAMLNALDDPEQRKLYKERLSHANTQTQRDRLTELVVRAAEPVDWHVDVETVISQIIQTRNWMIHWGKRGKFAVEEPDDVLMLVRCLELIVYVNLMLDLGLAEDGIRAGVGSGWRFEHLP